MNLKQHLTLKFTVLAIVALITSSPALAHKVRIFAWDEGDTIHTESRFSGGKAARNSEVSVFENQSDTVLLSGKTDEQGYFSFTLPKTKATEIEIVVDSGDGHKNSWVHQISSQKTETTTAPTTSTGPNSQTAPNINTKENKISPTLEISSTSISTQAASSINGAELAVLIDNILEKKIAPIRRTLAENRNQGPTLQDILGGIGYILGLAGITAYFKSKNRR